MKKLVRLTIDLDIDSGDYEIEFNNLSNPGEGIELSKLYGAIRLVLEDFVDKATESPDGTP